MNKINSVLIGILLIFAGVLLSGAFLEKTEAKLKVIKAGVDEKGHPVCVNKSQVYLFKKNEVEKTIVFFYHDPSSQEAMVKKSFSDVEKLNKYWDDLLKNW